eukprot:g3623.t1
MASPSASLQEGIKPQLARLEDAAASTRDALDTAVETAAADKAELKQLIVECESRIMAEIGKVREEFKNHMDALRQGIDATRKTLTVHKGESTVQAERLRGTGVKVSALEDQLQQLVHEVEGDALYRSHSGASVSRVQ